MEPSEIFQLIIRADDAVKYATEDKLSSRARQAREYLARAIEEAHAIGDLGLAEQAERRLVDLDLLLSGQPAAESGPEASGY
jgi:hypothetical protein